MHPHLFYKSCSLSKIYFFLEDPALTIFKEGLQTGRAMCNIVKEKYRKALVKFHLKEQDNELEDKNIVTFGILFYYTISA